MLYYITPLLAAFIALAPAVEMPKSPAPEVQTKETEQHEPAVSCSCVATAIAYGSKIPLIDASRMKVATTTPSVGGTALFYYPRSGLHHVAHITQVGDGWFRTIEGNYEPCTLTTRTVRFDDPRLLGFL